MELSSMKTECLINPQNYNNNNNGNHHFVFFLNTNEENSFSNMSEENLKRISGKPTLM